MSFALSKVFGFLFAPPTLLLLVLLAGVAALWLGRVRLARGLLTGLAGVLLFLAVVPAGKWLAIGLENRFPQPTGLPARIDGIVVLGGFVDQFVTAARGQPSLNASAERLTEALALWRRHPEARLVMTGGSGNLLRQDLKETEVVRQVLDQLGFDPAAVTFEDQSRNTWENAVLTRDLVAPRPDETWVLITSASHMPRAVGAFRNAGWPAATLPYPVDYTTDGTPPAMVTFNLGGSLRLFEVAHELLGLAAYRLMGRSADWFPAPLARPATLPPPPTP